MQRGTPRRTAAVLAIITVLLALGPTAVPAQESGDPAPPYEGGEGTFESDRSSEPGLRRSGERPWRRTPESGERESFGKRYLETLGWLVLVVALAIGSIVLLRRIGPGSVHPQNRRLVQVIGRGALGPKHQVVVTKVGERILILGLTSDSIVSLGEVDDPREAVRMTPPEETFAGRVTLSEAAYLEEDAARGEVDDSSLEPYRREIDRLKGMVDIWQQQDRRGSERGTA